MDGIAKEIRKKVVKTSDARAEPRGACHVTVYTMKRCYNNFTLKMCAKLGKEVGGTASWEKGGEVPQMNLSVLDWKPGNAG
jgi:hypothetical protein